MASERRIGKVPPFLREVKHNRDAYDPKVVSFGPYHHGKPELQFCQHAKHLALQMFVAGTMYDTNFFEREVSNLVAYARSCYVQESTARYSDEEFVEMMLLDACFLIFIMGISDETNQEHRFRIYKYMGGLVTSMLERDMFLLENQIPFRVVMELINWRYDRQKGEEGVTKCLHKSVWGEYKNEQGGAEEVLLQDNRGIYQDRALCPLHLLEAFHRVLVLDFIPRNQVNIVQGDFDGKRFHYSFRSATDLKAKGIYLRPSEKRSLKSIDFKSFIFYGQLELPVWFVSSLSKVFFPNMIAYELGDNFTVDTTVTSYLTFMKSLIERPADVKEMREKRILLTTLGSDEDVVQFYSNLDTFEMGDPRIFMEVKGDIQKHYDSKVKTWRAELIHTYLSSPWSVIAWVAAFLLLILTFSQTYFTIAK